MKMSKQFRIAALILVGGIVVASSACSVEGVTTASTESSLTPAARPLASASGNSGQTASATGSLPNGTYVFQVDPRVDQVVRIGNSQITLPANSVCALGVSGYGPTLWNTGCNPQKRPFTLTVTVAGSGTQDAALDFQPSMRFNPTKTVLLSFYVDQLNQHASPSWTIFYCPTPNGKPGARLGTNLMRADPTCVDESLADPSLKVTADYEHDVLLRRVKHFSAYQVNSGYVLPE